MLQKIIQGWVDAKYYRYFAGHGSAAPYNLRLARLKATLYAIYFHDFPEPESYSLVNGDIQLNYKSRNGCAIRLSIRYYGWMTIHQSGTTNTHFSTDLGECDYQAFKSKLIRILKE